MSAVVSGGASPRLPFDKLRVSGPSGRRRELLGSG